MTCMLRPVFSRRAAEDSAKARRHLEFGATIHVFLGMLLRSNAWPGAGQKRKFHLKEAATAAEMSGRFFFLQGKRPSFALQFSQVRSPDPPVADLSCLLSSHPTLILSVASGTGVMPVTVPIYNGDRWKKGEKRVRKVTTVGRQNECVKPFSPLSRMIVGPQKKDNIFHTCLLVLIPWDLPGA